MTYMQSSSTQYVSMYVTGRVPSDPTGTMETGAETAAGSTTYIGGRGGDFSGITVDPSAGTTFWAANEYVPSSEGGLWGTEVSEFNLSVATTRTWTGGGSTSNWSDPNNWGGTAPNAGDSLVFPSGVANTTSNNDFAAGTTFGSITLSGAGYTITGNALGLQGGLDGSAATGNNSFGPNLTLLTNEGVNAGGGTTDLSLGGTVSLGAFTLTVGGGSGTVEFDAPIGGTGGLTVNNTGTTDLKGGGNTYTGTTSVQGGTLVPETTSGVGVPGALTVGAATVRLGASNQTASTATVTLNPSALLDLNGNSTSVGPLVLSGATVTTGSGTLTVGGKITDSGASSISGNLALSAGSETITVNTAGTLTVSAAVSGSSSLTKTGSGALVLTAANTYSGGTTLSAGSLKVGNNNALGSGTLTLSGGSFLATGSAVALPNAVTLAGSVTIGGSLAITFTGAATLTGSRTLTVNDTALATFAAPIGQSASGFSLTQAGTGLLALTAANTYSGGTTLGAGTIEVGNNNALGTGTLTLKSGTFMAIGSAVTLPNAVTLAGGVTIGGTLAITFTGPATLTASRTLTVSNTGLTTFVGAVGQSASGFALTKAGAGALALTAADTYSGGTTLSAGTLEVGNNSALGTGTLTLKGGTFMATGSAAALANAVSLAGNATIGGSLAVTFNGAATLTGSRTLTVTNTALTTFAAPIGQSASGFALTKAGTGTLVLAAANTYTGATTISGGTLLVNGSVAGSVSVRSGGTLGGSGTTGAVTASSGGTVFPGNGTGQTAILNTGQLLLNSGSALTVALNGTTAGTQYDQVNVTSGTVTLTGSTLNVSVGYAANVGDSWTIIHNGGGSPVVGTFSGLAEGATFMVNGMTLRITYKGGSGHDVVLTRIA
jgi:autotransporter-associated beta strand protein